MKKKQKILNWMQEVLMKKNKKIHRTYNKFKRIIKQYNKVIMNLQRKKNQKVEVSSSNSSSCRRIKMSNQEEESKEELRKVNNKGKKIIRSRQFMQKNSQKQIFKQ